MNIAEIRKKFPQYADLPDEQLVIGLHRKFYSDMPFADFHKSIQYNAPSPTEGMGGLDKFNAGMGKAFTDLGRGVGQLFGMGPSGEEVQESRKLDAPLMKTGAGVAGNVAGNVAAFAPLAAVPGAATVAGAAAMGSAMAGMQPTEGVGERIGNMAGGAALGGAMQGALAYPAQVYEGVKSAVTYPFRAAHAAVEPLYEGGRQNILSRALAEATGPGRQQAITNLQNAKQLIPGSQPTAAEVAESGGIAAMQRAAAQVDPESYATRGVQQNEARVKALNELSGTGGERAFHAANRDATAQQLYDQAYTVGIDLTKMSPARRGEITKLLNTPAIKNAVEEAQTLAANEMVNVGNPAGSVKGLDYVKRALDDQIRNAVGNEQRVLTGLKQRLLTTIDTLSPEYGAARKVYQDMSRPINQMDTAQHIANKAVDPFGKMNPQAYGRAFSDDAAAAATGWDKATLANTMEPQQIQLLEALKQDLGRSVMARDLGRGAGSDTTQKLAMTNLMARSGLPLGVVNAPGVSRVANWLYQNSDDQMRQALAQALLDPKQTAKLMQRYQPYVPMAAPSKQITDNAGMMARALLLPAGASR